ncbi:site-specific DNA-methyltransferase [Prosthecochloris sp. N3]|uniref:site-specific DNA-methyltransferase (adenine-specific) n=1 Tax=Prosthecochloris ethylica TaxID=2743976 RepID=A0ABR9XQW8_9CHLB|nr:site-specific DNA-methyltransferase [Prosthecochloris ethylica]MBF0585405.1 site-specific DNA-methyltransferase [Prosthecochloris ethylica]MBF0636191.1 site-specific DNA-methyltransferase [Prosthecochloris ethylica]NUK46635.1 site-specific DNA-methyltransferase [Prosthecochloris ethylica]
MDKLKMHSPNLTEEHIRKIRDLFPGCVTEAKDENGNLKLAVDFDLLKQELSDSIVDGPQERYHLNWPGKREALLTANAPIAKTLRPCREKSVDFETTQNLFIEGDNLDALKLLQETYLGKVKMIYIDPPYNTGNDFIYEDDFAVDKSEYELASGVRDEQGNKQFEEDRWKQNSAAKGRFHSDWLSMMYPRLKLSRNLLREDGVMFISIDDGEVAQLRKMCDEVFGEGNFVAQLVWERAFSPKNDAKFISNSHDYVLMFAKSILDFTIGRLERTAETDSRYTNPDNDPRGPWSSSDISVKTYAAANDYPIKAPSGKIIEPPAGRCWSLSKKAFLERLEDNRIWFGPNGDNVPRIKRFLSEIREGMTPTSILFYKEVGHSQEGSQEVKKLLGDQGVFDGPKPVRLLRRLLTIANTDKDALILDFFAGSSTTAHAVMQLNAEDGGNRKFIMVQLPEPCDAKSEAFRAGYQNIAEISKERIRRAGKKIKDEKSASSLDTGFRVLKVDTSNMAEVYYTPDAVKQEMLFDNVNNIKPDRTPEDLLFQVLLDWGVELTLPIRREPMHGKTVFFVDENALAACFDTGITEELVKALATYQPLRVIFRDNGFESDALKINVEQIFRQLSPETEVKTI